MCSSDLAPETCMAVEEKADERRSHNQTSLSFTQFYGFKDPEGSALTLLHSKLNEFLAHGEALD